MMYRFFTLLAAGFLLICFCTSCGSTQHNAIDYQSYPMELKCTVRSSQSEGEAQINISAPGEGVLLFKSPETLDGFEYTVGEEGTSLTYDGTVFPLPRGEAYSSAEAVIGALSLKEDSFIHRRTYPRDGGSLTVYSYETAYGEAEVSYTAENKSGIPDGITVGDITITDINIK